MPPSSSMSAADEVVDVSTSPLARWRAGATHNTRDPGVVRLSNESKGLRGLGNTKSRRRQLLASMVEATQLSIAKLHFASLYSGSSISAGGVMEKAL
jgi:hypothetical protein